ncbi:hypothetical protein CASFOL_040171 [Castilleja foliolosa]|uniref:S-protein homolog n=1 Tax=Castilleja foliolosa TaxID=1961234 RepID=A0ABD3BF22_9LAMI
MANYSYLHFVLIILAANLIASATSKNCTQIEDARTVYIYSYLPPDSPMMRLHCASKDDDLGNHTLALNQRFMFEFCTNEFTTLFYCDAWWGPKHVPFHAYEQRPFLRSNCDPGDTCYWAAKTDGLYFSAFYPPRGLKKRFNWS